MPSTTPFLTVWFLITVQGRREDGGYGWIFVCNLLVKPHTPKKVERERGLVDALTWMHPGLAPRILHFMTSSVYHDDRNGLIAYNFFHW